VITTKKEHSYGILAIVAIVAIVALFNLSSTKVITTTESSIEEPSDFVGVAINTYIKDKDCQDTDEDCLKKEVIALAAEKFSSSDLTIIIDAINNREKWDQSYMAFYQAKQSENFYEEREKLKEEFEISRTIAQFYSNSLPIIEENGWNEFTEETDERAKFKFSCGSPECWIIIFILIAIT